MEKKDNSPAITKSYARKMETISPFELKNKLIDMADESVKKIAHTMLNAGRGNPNWKESPVSLKRQGSLPVLRRS